MDKYNGILNCPTCIKGVFGSFGAIKAREIDTAHLMGIITKKERDKKLKTLATKAKARKST